MKCVYVGDFTVPYSTEVYIAYALQQCGVEVIKWQEDQKRNTADAVIDIVGYKPDFVLFCKARMFGNARQVIHALKLKGILTVTWLFDLYWDLPTDRTQTRSPLDPPFSADMVFTTDGGHDQKWKELEVNHYLLRQGIHAPEAYLATETIATTPIVFVGTLFYNNRIKLMENLRMLFGDQITHYGDDGEGGKKRGHALNVLYHSTKVVIGDSQPSLNYWSNRIYETLGRGGFLLHPSVPGLEKEFEYYTHFVPYNRNDFREIRDITEYYLTHDEERKKIQLAGHEFVKKNYTYTIRCQELLRKISEFKR